MTWEAQAIAYQVDQQAGLLGMDAVSIGHVSSYDYLMGNLKGFNWKPSRIWHV